MKITSIITALAVSIGMLSGTVMAHEVPGPCVVEDWRVDDNGPHIGIEGVTSCKSGKISIRLYDGDKFVGVTDGYIEGYIFEDWIVNAPAVEDPRIKYFIEAR